MRTYGWKNAGTRGTALLGAVLALGAGCVQHEAAPEVGAQSGALTPAQNLEMLFPDIARGGAIGEGKYNTEACMPMSTDVLKELIWVPVASAGKLFAKLGMPNPCADNGDRCWLKFHSNTLHVGKDVTITNGALNFDAPAEADGIAPTTLKSTNSGEIVVADNIKITGPTPLAAGKTYIFVARESVTIDGSIYTDDDPYARADGYIKVTRTLDDLNLATTRISGPTNKKGANGQDGLAGPNVIVIAPKVTGAGYFNLDGVRGQGGENVPRMACHDVMIPDPPGCQEIHNPSFPGWSYQDSECWEHQGAGFKGGDGGDGGHGGNLLIISDDAAATNFTTSFGGGAAGDAGDAGFKVLSDYAAVQYAETGAQLGSNSCVPVTGKSYGAAGANGVKGANGKKQTVALNGKVRDYLFWLGGRAGRRDLLNARQYSLFTDADQTGGPTNRAKAVTLYKGVLEQFCETNPPIATATTPPPHPYLPDDELLGRVALCHEVKSRLAPMEKGLNYFGFPADFVVYADPAQLKEQRDRYLAAFKDSYYADFKAAKAAGEDPILKFYEYTIADANASKAQRVAEKTLALHDRDRYQQAARDAWQQLTANLKLIDDESFQMNSLYHRLDDMVQPAPDHRSVFEQALGTITDAIGMTKALVKLIVDVYDENYFAAVTDFMKFMDEIKDANDFFGTNPHDPYDLSKELNTQVAADKGKLGQALCEVEQKFPIKMLESLERTRQDIATYMADPKGANAVIDVMKRLALDIEEQARASCGLWQTFTLAGRDARLAQERLDLATLKLNQATSLANLAASLDPADVHARYDQKRDIACQEAKIWEEQIMMYDFLTARAEYYGNFREPSTRAAKGDFRWKLLDEADSAAYRAEAVTGALTFDGWTRAETWTSDYLRSDAECAPGGPETAERCATERAAMAQLLDTGVIRLRPEDGPARFPMQTERNYGRVTHVDASLLGPTGTWLADRVGHDSYMSFVKTGAATRNVHYSPAASRDLCEVLEARNNALRSRVSALPQSLHCETVPSRFAVGAGIATPDLLVWKNRDTSWSEASDQWNMFGASARGMWTLDFRGKLRELNRQDRCYSRLVAAQPGLHSADSAVYQAASSDATACLGDAFLSAQCKALGEQSALTGTIEDGLGYATCLALEQAGRVDLFAATCKPRLTGVADGLALLTDPTAVFDPTPADCDRVCGPRCQALKASVTGLRLNLQTRTSN